MHHISNKSAVKFAPNASTFVIHVHTRIPMSGWSLPYLYTSGDYLAEKLVPLLRTMPYYTEIIRFERWQVRTVPIYRRSVVYLQV